MLKIRVLRDGIEERVVDVHGREALIGRAADCDVLLSEDHVSSHHMLLMAGLVVVDLSSTNGTFLGGQRVKTAELIGGRELRIGGGTSKITLQIEAQTAGPVQAAPPQSKPFLTALSASLDGGPDHPRQSSLEGFLAQSLVGFLISAESATVITPGDGVKIREALQRLLAQGDSAPARAAVQLALQRILAKLEAGEDAAKRKAPTS